jgi:dTDP-glucose pyrophosphorylase
LEATQNAPAQSLFAAASIKTSARGELEVTKVNKCYLELKQLNVEIMGRGCAWLDNGTHDSLLEASGFITTLQMHQWSNRLAKPMANTPTANTS